MATATAPPAVSASEMFNGIGGAKVRLDSNYERPGRYIQRINRVKIDKNRKGLAFMAIEKTVLMVLDNDGGRGHKVGEDATHLLMKDHDSFLGNVKGFIANVLGIKPEEVGLEESTMICSPEQPLAGVIIEVASRNQVTKAGKDFTVINYKREVPARELMTILPPDIQKQYFPNGLLETMAKEQEKLPAATGVK